jgi:hypothetical protein
MAELNEVFIFSKELLKDLPVHEGIQSIYGVRPSYMFNDNHNNNNAPNDSRIFQRTTYNSNNYNFE